jgi:hypothetical protein
MNSFIFSIKTFIAFGVGAGANVLLRYAVSVDIGETSYFVTLLS